MTFPRFHLQYTEYVLRIFGQPIHQWFSKLCILATYWRFIRYATVFSTTETHFLIYKYCTVRYICFCVITTLSPLCRVRWLTVMPALWQWKSRHKDEIPVWKGRTCKKSLCSYTSWRFDVPRIGIMNNQWHKHRLEEPLLSADVYVFKCKNWEGVGCNWNVCVSFRRR
jgi:hypothetical protein